MRTVYLSSKDLTNGTDFPGSEKVLRIKPHDFQNKYEVILLTFFLIKIENYEPNIAKLIKKLCSDYIDPVDVLDCSFSENFPCLKMATFPRGIMSMGRNIFEDHQNITTIFLPEGLKKIDDHCFTGCSNLKCIKLPSTLEVIGQCAFSSCRSLKNIDFPKSLQRIDRHAFSRCSSLDISVYVDFIVEKWAFYMANLNEVIVEGGKISEHSFRFASVKKITIKRDCSISEHSFCRTNVEQMICYRSFIPYACFYQCDKLKKINIVGDCTIGEKCFAGCTMLEKVHMGNDTQFCNSSFSSTFLETIDFPLPYNIPDFCFSDNSHLVKLVVPGNVEYIYSQAFKGCSKLKEIVFNEGLMSIHDSAFWKCFSLEKLVFPKSLKRIDGCAFEGCSALKEIVFLGIETIYNNTSFLETHPDLEIIYPSIFENIFDSD